MPEFHKFLSLSLCIVFCGYTSALDPNAFSPLSINYNFPEIRPESELLRGQNHKITKRNAFETLRELTSGSDSTNGQLVVNRRIYNSSIALTIPFYSFKIPHLPDTRFAVNEAIFGIFAWGITGLVFGLSFIFTGSSPSEEQSRSFQRLSDQAKTSRFNFLGSDFSRSFGMDGIQCMQKVICQAHSPREGKRYGIMSTSIRKLFPAPENDTNLLNESPSPFQSAAKAGKYSGKICDNLFDCILDPLGSARYLIHWYSHKYENARFLLQLVDYEDLPSLDIVGTNLTTIYNNKSGENS